MVVYSKNILKCVVSLAYPCIKKGRLALFDTITWMSHHVFKFSNVKKNVTSICFLQNDYKYLYISAALSGQIYWHMPMQRNQ